MNRAGKIISRKSMNAGAGVEGCISVDYDTKADNVVNKKTVKVTVSSSSADGQHEKEQALEKNDNYWMSRLGDTMAHYAIDF